jgi:hypothetical protein
VTKGELFIITILPVKGEFYLKVEDSLGKVPSQAIPNNYLILNKKLFVWHDTTTPLSKEVLNVLHDYQALDSTDIKMELGLLHTDFIDKRLIEADDSLESVDYFICSNNLKKFKKVYSSLPIQYYQRPKLRCQ